MWSVCIFLCSLKVAVLCPAVRARPDPSTTAVLADACLTEKDRGFLRGDEDQFQIIKLRLSSDGRIGKIRSRGHVVGIPVQNALRGQDGNVVAGAVFRRRWCPALSSGVRQNQSERRARVFRKREGRSASVKREKQVLFDENSSSRSVVSISSGAATGSVYISPKTFTSQNFFSEAKQASRERRRSARRFSFCERML